MSDIDDIKARTDIFDLVSSYVTLQKTGSTFKALCPFHTEKTPSFIVNPERQSWHCFGACGTGGDAFSFVMRKENLDFGGALRLLADKAGVELKRPSDNQRDDALHRVTRAAATFYQDTLSSDAGEAGRAYLKARGVDKQTAEKFMLGLSTDSWDGLKSYLLTHDFDIADAIRAGLVTQGENDNTRDFFRGRLMFPISDRRGNITGFGARALYDSGDSNPKYINTASTPIFDKRSTLYGLDLAMESVRRLRSVVIVEGYMDAIAAHQHGYDNVVASMGTALTEQQVSQLRTLADRFILALDPDAAGQAATLRSLESAWHVIQSTAARQRQRSQSPMSQFKNVDLRIAALPAGQDPDAIIREDPARWDQLTSDALPLLDYMIPNISSGFDLNANSGRVQVVDIIWPLIRSLDDLDQDHYLRQLAQAIGVTVEALRASLGSRSSEIGRSRHRQQGEITKSALVGARDDLLEDYAMAMFVSAPELAAKFEGFNTECLRKIENRQVFTKLLSCSSVDDLRESIDESLHHHLAHLADYDLVATDFVKGETALTQMLKRLEDRYWREIQETLLATDDPREPPSVELEAEVTSVNARIRESEPMGTGPARLT